MKSILFMMLTFLAIGVTTAYAIDMPDLPDFQEPYVMFLDIEEALTGEKIIYGDLHLVSGFDTMTVYQEYHNSTTTVPVDNSGTFQWIYQEYRSHSDTVKPKFSPITVGYAGHERTVTGVYQPPHP